jgi:Ala-tRNA(Pro) deacylase
MIMRVQQDLYHILEKLNISYDYFEHPPVDTVEQLDVYAKNWNTTRCKNLFFRNHKGNRHYLVILRHDRNLKIKELEGLLKQGKITFASDWRLKKYLGQKRGGVSPFGLINDLENHVFVFIDKTLLEAEHLTFHPNTNDASLKIRPDDLIRFLDWSGNGYSFIQLY